MDIQIKVDTIYDLLAELQNQLLELAEMIKDN